MCSLGSEKLRNANHQVFDKHAIIETIRGDKSEVKSVYLPEPFMFECLKIWTQLLNSALQTNVHRSCCDAQFHLRLMTV